jgi:hypothetical protein
MGTSSATDDTASTLRLHQAARGRLPDLGHPLRAEFDDCEVTIGPGTTTLRAELPDRSALTGLMERISGLGLDVIDVSLVASPPEG